MSDYSVDEAVKFLKSHGAGGWSGDLARGKAEMTLSIIDFQMTVANLSVDEADRAN